MGNKGAVVWLDYKNEYDFNAGGLWVHTQKICKPTCSPTHTLLNKPSAFVQDHVHLWMAKGRKKLLHLALTLAIPGDICKINGLLLYPLTSPHSCSVKEPGIKTLIRWLFWDISLPSSQSASFLNILIFLASIPVSWIYLCGEQSKLGLSNMSGIYYLKWDLI